MYIKIKLALMVFVLLTVSACGPNNISPFEVNKALKKFDTLSEENAALLLKVKELEEKLNKKKLNIDGMLD